jgi:hypothetical protein
MNCRGNSRRSFKAQSYHISGGAGGGRPASILLLAGVLEAILELLRVVGKVEHS